MEVYNISSLNRNSRFLKACIAGLLSAIGLGILYGWISSLLWIEMSILYIAIGYGISQVIQKVGRGVTTRFCVIGGIFTFIAIFIGDVISMYGFQAFISMFTSPSFFSVFLTSWMRMYLSTNINSLLGLLFRIVGIYFGYRNSAIL